MSAVISRKEAKSLRMRWYFTGLPCKYGHVRLRLTNNGACIECSQRLKRISAEKYRINNQQKVKQAFSNWYKKNRENILEIKATKRKLNPEIARSKDRNYYAQNSAKCKARQARYKKLNRAKFTAAESKRRAAKLNACPKWADTTKLNRVYTECPKGYTVDHIVPLQSKIVCGLHVHWNLQYLLPSDNFRKGNRMWEHHPAKISK
jgi:hypothetical protein